LTNRYRQANRPLGVRPDVPHDLPAFRAETQFVENLVAAVLGSDKSLSPQGGELVFGQAQVS